MQVVSALMCLRRQMRSLPYAVQFEYMPLKNADQNSTIYNYDSLIQQLALKKVDAVVADITMSATRAQQVDFTIPYIESRISTVVPIKEKESAWDFMEPLTSKLWLAIGATFVFTGFVVWLLEYRLNEAASQADRDDFLVRLLNTNFITEGESEEQIRGDCVAICRARAIDELHCELDIFAQSDFRNITMKGKSV
ncbi:glutamate receptor 2.7-like [Salvia splendens]|uniref:glutamate receptor 2.7-like n=1 Tax=Salvia splendens TaxID=180675 RepID=UPI001C275580|nr:glutamate receptor 2.7-like [Salvia splendens]